MPLAEASGAICVQRFDGSRNSAIHTTYRISLRSSSIREPRYPLLRVVIGLKQRKTDCLSRLLKRCLVWGGKKVRQELPTPGSPKEMNIPHVERRPPDLKPRLESPGQGTGARNPDRLPGWRGKRWVTRVDSIDSMILPQVHLRKPCYDFSFL